MQNIALKKQKVYFERAIFISWYCSLGDCTYCYMSTQKNLILDPKKAKRSMASILAEAYLCKKLGWKIGNLAAGYGSYTPKSILELCKNVYGIYGKKLWLNIGVLPERTIDLLSPYLEGIYGAVETTNEEVHKAVAPNKPIAPIEKMFLLCEKYNLKKAMTFIVGLGESIDDFETSRKFIIKNNIDKIVFYALNPIKGTAFENSEAPEIDYYLEWIKRTRREFPKLDIVAGPWVKRSINIDLMLEAGANGITKFPMIRLFNSEFTRTMEDEIKKAGYELEGTFTKLPVIDTTEIYKYNFDRDLKDGIIRKVNQYIEIANNDKKHH